MVVQWALGISWIVGLIGALLFLVLYGSPRHYSDRAMAWHLFWTSVAGGLQFIGLLLARWSLIPLLIADWISVGIIYWRTVLLIGTRNRARMITRDKDKS